MAHYYFTCLFFLPVLLLALQGSVDSSVVGVGSTTAAAGGLRGRQEDDGTTTSSSRRLEYSRLAGYEPRTQVTDQAALDEDQASMEEELFLGALLKAKNIYEEGGHSKSYALLKLVTPQGPYAFAAGTDVYGKTSTLESDGEQGEVFGTLVDDAAWGQDNTQNVTIKVAYKTSDVQGRHVGCKVGGLYTISEANRDGW